MTLKTFGLLGKSGFAKTNPASSGYRATGEAPASDPYRGRGEPRGRDRPRLPGGWPQRDVFEEEQRLSFWIKDTPIVLSIGFVASQGRIVDTQEMKLLDDELPDYISAEAARYALEVNWSFFEERGSEVGDKVELPAWFSPRVPRVRLLGCSAMMCSLKFDAQQREGPGLLESGPSPRARPPRETEAISRLICRPASPSDFSLLLNRVPTPPPCPAWRPAKPPAAWPPVSSRGRRAHVSLS